jgi:hypothetical protein
MDSYKKNIIINLGVMLLSIAVFVSITFWFFGRIEAESARAIEAKDELEGRSYAIEASAVLKKDISEAAGYRKGIEVLLDREDQLLDMPTWIRGAARVYGLNLNFSFSDNPQPATNDSLGRANFNFTAEGDYQSLLNFMEELEIHPQRFLIVFNGFQFVRSQDNYKLDVDGKVLFR